MSNLQQLRAEREKLANELHQLIDSNPGKKWNAEHQKTYDAKLAKVGEIDASINRLINMAESLNGDNSLPGGFGGASMQAKCSEMWKDAEGRPVPVLAKGHKLSNHLAASGHPQVKAADLLKALFTGGGSPEIRAALSEGTDSAGGYSVPDFVSAQVIDNARAKSHVINAGALTVALNTEKSLITKIASDPTVAWRLENAAIAESDPTFAGVSFQARSLAVLVKVSRELLEDSLNIGEALHMALSAAIAAELDRVCLIGSGVAPQPTGILNTAGINTVSMGTNGLVPIAYTQMLTAYQNILEGNCEDPSAVIMSPRSLIRYGGLVDTTGQPMRKPELLTNVPFLATSKIGIADTVGTSSDCSKAFMGCFCNLMIGMRSALRIEILREAFATNHQVAFVAHMRADVAVTQPKAFTVITGIR
jgi:HK97 family phage major capsid protein